MHYLRKYKWLLLVVLCFLANAVFGQISWKPTTAVISFKIKNAGFTVSGNFKGFDGQLLFDPDALSASSLHASVAAGTINTGNSTRDNHLKSGDYFGATAYPKIEMSSKNIYRKDNGFAGIFNLTIKNKTKQVEIPFTFTTDGNTGIFDGSLTIDRRDFGVGGNSIIMSDNVSISIIVNAKK